MPPRSSAANIKRRLATRRFDTNAAAAALRSNYQHALARLAEELPRAERACLVARMNRNHAAKQLCKRYDQLAQEWAELQALRRYVL